MCVRANVCCECECTCVHAQITGKETENLKFCVLECASVECVVVCEEESGCGRLEVRERERVCACV